MPDTAGPKIVIAGTREDWPGGAQTLTPRDPTREQKHDPGRVGVVTNRPRARGGIRRLQVRFADGAQYVPEDQLEGIGSEGDDPLDLLKRGRLGDAADLRRAVTHARLTGRLADVITSRR